jgi:hypothetical protein
MLSSTKNPRARDRAYLTALHEMVCVTCGSSQNIEAAHIRVTRIDWTKATGIRTGAGGAEKPSDAWAVPLCSSCHREGPDAEHRVGTIAFWKSRGLDPHEIASELYRAFLRGGARAMASSMLRIRTFGTRGKP